ncbi:LuxR C-terminal-related transcriptional regulator [Solirubrobacter phytolaccae]|uniref:LuxR C-terminal-related transcriptional regulator n=1 Tax=Solirubrobacter phytolaccae TaxID=1404360 RepID=A0A9X3NIZ4_9ACTN|nr:LuxR C-terminal-related transcriptional regulator [Solirubrobacter phytolaccae]MDA0182202.1 LuxR C-terminal-related transcriptional regulator [Solirubrobacter phytolaccae]
MKTKRTSDEDFVAIRTKLLVPELRGEQAGRLGLVRVLEAGRARRLTLVAAPTGFGKTTMLAAWAAVSPARFAWVSLDEADDEPTRFWSYVVAALEGAAPEFSGTPARRLRAPGVQVADEVLPALVNALGPATTPLVLVLDDYHLIADATIHEDVGYLLERLGPGVHVVLAGQADPPLKLGRLRARGELNELRVQQLRFSDEEATALLNGQHGLKLAPEQIAAVQHRTEGWVAGLNLVALSLRDAADREGLMARMPVGDRFLADYLWEEVAAHQTPDTRAFLMRTSVLERLSGPLCDAVANGTDSAQRLLALERGNLFVVPLDAERRWYRYHHMFRAMLRRQLERQEPDAVADLHRRASAWFADQGDLAGVIDHALLAGDAHVAADALQRHWLDLYSDGWANSALGWIDRLPRTTLNEYPRLSLARAGIARAMGRLDEVEPWLTRVEHAAAEEGDETARRDLRAGLARQRSMLALVQADVGGAVRLGRLAIAERPPDSPEAPADSYFLGICLFWTGATAEAEQRLRAYLDVTAPGEQDVRRVFAMALLATAHARRGELDAAQRLVEASLATTDRRGLGEHPPTEQTHVAAGIVAFQRDAYERAEEHLEHAATLARRGGDRLEIAHALLWLGRARARSGDGPGAGDALTAARIQLRGARVPSLVELERVLEHEIRSAPAAPESEAVDDELLSAAELRVLELLPSDLTYREIADRLYLSLNTVRTHGQRIRRKLGTSTRDEAVSAARRLGLL